MWKNTTLQTEFWFLWLSGLQQNQMLFPGDAHQDPKWAPRSWAQASFPVGLPFSIVCLSLQPSTGLMSCAELQLQEETMEGTKGKCEQRILSNFWSFLLQSWFSLHHLRQILSWTLWPSWTIGLYEFVLSFSFILQSLVYTEYVCQKRIPIRTVTGVRPCSHPLYCWVTAQPRHFGFIPNTISQFTDMI